MSPYLFALCMEKLSLLIQELVQAGKWLPIKIYRDGPAISHLLFADDCLLFTHGSSYQARVVKEVIDKFCKASGLKVNVYKSKFLPSSNIARSKVLKFESIVHFNHTYNIGSILVSPCLQVRLKIHILTTFWIE